MSDSLEWINPVTVLGHFLAYYTRRRCVPKDQASDDIKRASFPVNRGEQYCVDFVPVAERTRFADLAMAALQAMEAAGMFPMLSFAVEPSPGDPITVAYEYVQGLTARRHGYPREGGDVELPTDIDDYISMFETAIEFATDENAAERSSETLGNRITLEEFTRLLPDLSCPIDDPALEPVAVLTVEALKAAFEAQTHKLTRTHRADTYRAFRERAATVRRVFQALATCHVASADPATIDKIVRDSGTWIEDVLVWVKLNLHGTIILDDFQRLVERRDSLVSRFLLLRDRTTPTVGDVTSSDTCMAPTRLRPSEEKAYQSFEYAVSRMHPPPETDREAYNWLCEHFDQQDYHLPDFETWERYVRAGRKHHGTQKNTPRQRRTGHSVVRKSQL